MLSGLCHQIKFFLIKPNNHLTLHYYIFFRFSFFINIVNEFKILKCLGFLGEKIWFWYFPRKCTHFFYIMDKKIYFFLCELGSVRFRLNNKWKIIKKSFFKGGQGQIKGLGVRPPPGETLDEGKKIVLSYFIVNKKPDVTFYLNITKWFTTF